MSIAALRKFVPDIKVVSEVYGVDPFLLAGQMLRESLAGDALRPKGPGGTGDWTARVGGWVRNRYVKVLGELPEGWAYPMRDGVRLPGPYAIPADGRGWGRGLMQIDYTNSLAIHWDVPVDNIMAACRVLCDDRRWFKGHGSVPNVGPVTFDRLVLASYNCGPERARKGLVLHGDPDFYTTGQDYSKDVFARAEKLRKLVPELVEKKGPGV